MTLAWIIDATVVGLLLGLALRLLTTGVLMEAIILFIAYGFTLSLAWVRVGSPDLALAEAALGAGVTGALLLNAFQRLARRRGTPPAAEPLLRDDRSRDGPRWLRLLLGAAALPAAAAMAFLLVAAPERTPLLPDMVHQRLGESGASNPVTGVLLNFRSYDTLLELVVLVAAVLAVWSLDRDVQPRALDRRDRSPDPVLHALVRFVTPLAAVTAFYLAWAGSHRPGGGFQAGALMAGAGILLEAGGHIPPFSAASRGVRGVLAFGLTAFVGVGLGSMASTGSFLAYPPEWAHGLMVGLEAAIAFTVTVILIEFFVDVPAVPAGDPTLERVDPTGDPLGRLLTRRPGGKDVP